MAYLCDADNEPVKGNQIKDGLAVRFRMPQGEIIEFEDVVRGAVSFATDDLEDFVIWRSNGTPMFLLANAVDAADMGITHGCGPPDDVEIRPLEEIVELFAIEDVNKAAAFFDLKKLEFVNATLLRDLEKNDFIERAKPWVESDEPPWPPENFNQDRYLNMVDLVQEKLRTLSDLPRFVDFIFLEEPVEDPDSWNKAMVKAPFASEMLDGTLKVLPDCEWTTETIKEAVTEVGESLGIKLGKAQAPIRVAITGRTVGPPLFEAIALCMDRQTVLDRIARARSRL